MTKGDVRRRLRRAERRAALTAADEAASRQKPAANHSDAVRSACVHGATRGRCAFITCDHHPLGGIDLGGGS